MNFHHYEITHFLILILIFQLSAVSWTIASCMHSAKKCTKHHLLKCGGNSGSQQRTLESYGDFRPWRCLLSHGAIYQALQYLCQQLC